MKKIKERNRYTKTVIIVLVLLLILLATLTVSVALFSYLKNGESGSSIKSGSITFHYDEISGSGNNISIEDAFPISDEEGKAQSKYFNFKISSTTTRGIQYEITLRQNETNNVGNIIKVYLAKIPNYSATVSSEQEVQLSLYNQLDSVTHNGYTEKLLHTDIIPATGSSYEQYYRFKMWVDENADYLNEQYFNKTFTVMVNVYATGEMNLRVNARHVNLTSNYGSNIYTVEDALNDLNDIIE